MEESVRRQGSCTRRRKGTAGEERGQRGRGAGAAESRRSWRHGGRRRCWPRCRLGAELNGGGRPREHEAEAGSSGGARAWRGEGELGLEVEQGKWRTQGRLEVEAGGGHAGDEDGWRGRLAELAGRDAGSRWLWVGDAGEIETKRKEGDKRRVRGKKAVA